ncbi:hypothetical protein [Terriglobus sp.]|uniref:hypothetical protein n=1 Tax=Terriglobus sp. TaxID=1889013 RepID=UPI003B003514
MGSVIKGLQYFLAGLLGLVMAVLPTVLICWLILPPDGPVGEGFIIMPIHLFSRCACIPSYVALMGLHRNGRRNTRKLVACEVGLRLSATIAACFVCFMVIKLPTHLSTKLVFCLLAAFVLAWSLNPKTWEEKLEHTAS